MYHLTLSSPQTFRLCIILITGKEAEASRYSGICIFHLGHLSSKRHWIIRCGWLNANPSPKWKSSWKTCLIDQELTISDTRDISLLSLFTFFLDFLKFFLTLKNYSWFIISWLLLSIISLQLILVQHPCFYDSTIWSSVTIQTFVGSVLCVTHLSCAVNFCFPLRGFSYITSQVTECLC